jgi:uncharacterized Zn-finger protein
MQRIYDSFVTAACKGAVSVPDAGNRAQERVMAGGVIPHFQNDAGHPAIEIGVKEFMCVGANPPFDHPHVFLDMGSDVEKICPYCSTLFRFNPALKPSESVPAGCLYEAPVA